MAAAYQVTHDVQAAFLCNRRGDVCIAFDDPAYVRSDTIAVDPGTSSVYAVLHENERFLGHISPALIQAFCEQDTALLTALRPDGSLFEMKAPVSIISDKH
jgi:hypothetical protein